MRRNLIRRLQRAFALVSLILILVIGLLAGQALGMIPTDLGALVDVGRFLPAVPQVALISGHAGYDPGAVCTDSSGATVLTEVEVNARAAELAARRLRRANVSVEILEEYDDRLENLRATVLLSLHADSCVPLSGYKAAHRVNSSTPEADAVLMACIDQHYAARTGLLVHPNTITHNMTSYHAFGRVDAETPAAILEMGFLGGDQALLTEGIEQVAAGVVESVLCFLAEAESEK